MKNKKLLNHLFALITVIIWGTTFVSTKVLLKDLQPFEILFYRFLIGYFSLLIIYPKFKKISSWKEEALFLIAGLSGTNLYFLFENIALNNTFASNVGLIVSMSPILTALLAHLLTKDEKISKNLIIGSLITFVGVSLIIFNGKFVLNISPLGDLLALLATFVFAVYSISLKFLGDQHNYIYLTRKMFFYGLVTMLPLVFIFDFKIDVNKLLVSSVLPNILFLGLAASSLCFIMWNTAINNIGAIKTSNYIYIVPFITIITSNIILKEKITFLSILGLVLILLGLYKAEHNFTDILKFLKTKAEKGDKYAEEKNN